MNWLWTWSGKCFGYRDGEDLWTHDGKHVGKFYDSEIYGKDGAYLGEIMNQKFLIRNNTKSNYRKSSFTPLASRSGYAKYADYAGYVMYAGHEDFFDPSSFS